MPRHRHPYSLARALATALVLIALSAPAAVARPAAPDPSTASTGEPRQDLRSPDARDAAAHPRSATPSIRPAVVQPTQAGFDWGSVGIGAGAGLVVLSLGGVLVRTRAVGRGSA